jgi:YidC/Oxa1 family membrane protein insertase
MGGCGLPFAPLPARPALRLRRAGGRSCVRASAHLDADSGVALAEAARHAHAALAPLLQLADGSVDAAVDAAAAAPRTGFLNGIANVLESLLSGIDDGLAKAGVPYSYGFSIIVLTLLVKAATFPLSKKQIESTTAMQALQPRVKDLQVRRLAAALGPKPQKARPASASRRRSVSVRAGCGRNMAGRVAIPYLRQSPPGRPGGLQCLTFRARPGSTSLSSSLS